jgi:transposase InsO family protein
VSQESGVSRNALSKWLRSYRQGGEAALANRKNYREVERLPEAVSRKIVSIKKSNPEFGVRRIANLLRRVFCLPGSAETVRRVLIDEGVNNPPQKKRRVRNMTRPRFFERATPNQMWQTDIFTFRLGGRYAYLIGFIDDYSRYIVGMELYLSQTAENLIELYRRSTAEYGVPKEMLTDNGRQYTNWRGTSRFEAELQKDKVHHIKSQPHHPMTLGKIERFWKSIYEEFLVRAQFESFENARERVRLWVKYYNHRRPHQGIGGMCPADRYFEIQHDLRKTIETQIQENVLEMALRGKPKEPFYMVGRFEGQSVVLRAEKGKLRVLVDKENAAQSKELEYDLTGGEHNGENTTEERRETAPETTMPKSIDSTRCSAEVSGSAVPVVGAQDAGGSLSRAVNLMDYIKSMAGPGAGGDASGFGTQSTVGQGSGAESAAAGVIAEETSGVAQSAFDGSTQEPPATECGRTSAITCKQGIADDGESGGPCTGAGTDNHAGTQRNDRGDRGIETASYLAEDLLRVGEAGPDRDAQGTGGWRCRQTTAGIRSTEGGSGTAGERAGAGAYGCKTDDRSETSAGRLPTAAQAAAKRFRNN